MTQSKILLYSFSFRFDRGRRLFQRTSSRLRFLNQAHEHDLLHEARSSLGTEMVRGQVIHRWRARRTYLPGEE